MNVCPVCLAHPGTLPVINREAVRHVLRVGVALGGMLADYTEFDRKSYFYPDLPKGYQISQFEHPLVSGGTLRGVTITRVHLEEDTASSMHEEGSNITTIDFNRAGVPLIELVTEPVMRSAEEAGNFARELQLLLRYLSVSDANMEKGEMRAEANVSVRKKEEGNPPASGEKFGTKVEIKNLNSFRAMERAIAYEIKRQTELLERGSPVVQETRGWDEAKQVTFSQRTKEGSADYRYFPDPDLLSLRLSEIKDFSAETLKKTMPELPVERRERYLALGIQPDAADLFVRTPSFGSYFEEVVKSYAEGSPTIKLASNYIANDIVNLVRDTQERDSDIRPEIPVSAQNLKKILDMLMADKISSRTAKDLLVACVAEGGRDPEDIAEERGIFRINDDAAIEKVVRELLLKHNGVAADYRAGKEAALEYLVGQGMKALKGAVDPSVLRTLIRDRIIKNH